MYKVHNILDLPCCITGHDRSVNFYLEHEGLNFSTAEKVEALEMCAVSLFYNIVYLGIFTVTGPPNVTFAFSDISTVLYL